MLTGDLIRYRIKGEKVFPLYVTRKESSVYLDICGRLIRIFESHVGKTYGELSCILEEFEGERVDYKIIRGFEKFLEEKSEFCPPRGIDYPALRHRIFSLAQKYYPIVAKPDLLHQTSREQILSQVAKEKRLSPNEIDDLMYGDLTENQILTRFEGGYSPESLLKRYNLGLAQGLLYRARNMKIILRGDYRIVFQYMKLFRLIHRIIPLKTKGYEIILDGPASLFRNTQRYGVRLANFLPALLLAKNWLMSADVDTREGVKKFSLSDDCGLSSHYSKVPFFDSRIEEKFFNKFSCKDRGWRIERESEVVDLGNSVFIPDFTFRHPDGRVAHLEIVGFWTPEYLKNKKKKIKKSKCENLILAVNSKLNCGKEDWKGDVIYYKTGIKISDVIEKLNACEVKK
jgi:predicted nuclease of restriction endonuclease-like RecB superfamily